MHNVPWVPAVLQSTCRFLSSTAIVLGLGSVLFAGESSAQASILERPKAFASVEHGPHSHTPRLDVDEVVKMQLLGDVDARIWLEHGANRGVWWIIPTVGAGAGAVGLSYHVYRACENSDCLLNPLSMPVYGAVLGGVVGLGLEGLLRLLGV